MSPNQPFNDDNPFEFMHQVNRQFPGRKQDFILLAENYLQRKPNHGKAYVDLPFLMGYMAHKYRLNTRFKNSIAVGGMGDNQTLTKDAFSLAMFATWRLKPYIYEIDPDLFEQVKKSPLPFESPSTIFDNLPAWSVYVKLNDHQLTIYNPNHEFVSLDCHGFWAYKVYMQNQLWLLIYPHISQKDLDKTTNIQCFMPASFFVINKDYDLFESLRQGLFRMLEDEQSQNISPDIWEMHLNNSRLYLSLLLLLCVESPQIENQLGEDVSIENLSQMPAIQPKTKRFVAPDKPSWFHVGRRLGGEIRNFKTQLAQGVGSGMAMKPHIRQAHWHGYRYGEGRKHFKLKFLGPIFVNMLSQENLEDDDSDETESQ